MIEVITLESNSHAFKLQDSATEASASSDPGLLISLESAEENHAQGAVMKMSGQSEEAGASTSSCTSEAKLSWAALSTMEKGALGFSIGVSLLAYALVFRPLRGAPPLATVVASVGITLALQAVTAADVQRVMKRYVASAHRLALYYVQEGTPK